MSINKSETHKFGYTGWPVSPRDPPIPAYPVLGLQACTTMLCIYIGSGLQTQVLMLVWQALYQLSYLLRLKWDV